MPFSYGLVEHGTTFATRPYARELRDDLVAKAAGEKFVELDFNGVRSTSHSFADEFVAQIVEDSGEGVVGFEIAVSGMSEQVDRVVTAALKRRELVLPETV